MNELEGLFMKELKDKCVRRVQGPTASMFAHLNLATEEVLLPAVD